jgi:hypothetical protein
MLTVSYRAAIELRRRCRLSPMTRCNQRLALAVTWANLTRAARPVQSIWRAHSWWRCRVYLVSRLERDLTKIRRGH